MAEILVHLQRSNDVAPYVRWVIDVPDQLVGSAPRLPKNWKRAMSVTRAIGDKWLNTQASVANAVPSALVDGEYNVLLSPAHPDFTLGWVVEGPVRFRFDPRLTRR